MAAKADPTTFCRGWSRGCSCWAGGVRVGMRSAPSRPSHPLFLPWSRHWCVAQLLSYGHKHPQEVTEQESGCRKLGPSAWTAHPREKLGSTDVSCHHLEGPVCCSS